MNLNLKKTALLLVWFCETITNFYRKFIKDWGDDESEFAIHEALLLEASGDYCDFFNALYKLISRFRIRDLYNKCQHTLHCFYKNV